MALQNVNVVDISDLEKQDPALVDAKINRSLIEYYFTCTPSWLLHIFRNYEEPDVLTYLDADLFFFSDPSILYEEFGNASIGIVPHRFSPGLQHLQRFGLYNVGYLSFRRDHNANSCLHWWRERCLEWCHDYVEETRFADQKYLDRWPELFSGVKVFQQKGAAPGPWNVGDVRVTQKSDTIYIDSEPLIVYHFHGLKILKRHLFISGLTPYGLKLHRDLKKIYIPYLKILQAHLNDAPQTAHRTSKTDAHLYSTIAHNRIAIFFDPYLFEVFSEPVLEPLLKIKRSMLSH